MISRRRQNQCQRLRSSDHGAGTAAMLTVVFVALLMMIFLAILLQVHSARHQVQSAADLAALAAAQQLQVLGIGFEEHSDTQSICGIAHDTAELNNAQVVKCQIAQHDVLVTTQRQVRIMGAVMTVSARARAGPARQTEFGGRSIGG